MNGHIDDTVERPTARHASAPAVIPPPARPPNKSPSPARRVVRTQDDGPSIQIRKRIIICCDGTWQDGLTSSERWEFTNVLRLSRAICHYDDRTHPPMPQVVFYQSGVGTAKSIASRIVDGATGYAVEEKVEEVYGFISQNYSPGDEIFLFGFSRGAYTVRLVAQFIGDIGILDRTDMDYFADIFKALQKRGKSTDEKAISEFSKFLDPWTRADSRGRKRVKGGDPDAFSVKCVGVWDTVGAIGIPSDLPLPTETVQLFGFNDRRLGSYVERAYHAIALNEQRGSFDVCKFEQTKAGRDKGQILKQVWFAGVHTDVGGGYEDHDLSDIALGWMAACVGDILALDLPYLFTQSSHPTAAYGKQPPNKSRTGIFRLTRSIQREVPQETNDVTHEYIHPSALRQLDVQPDILSGIVEKNPAILWNLLPLEEQIEAMWPIKEDENGQNTIDAAAVEKHAQEWQKEDAIKSNTKAELRTADSVLKAHMEALNNNGNGPDSEPQPDSPQRPSRFRRFSTKVKNILKIEDSANSKVKGGDFPISSPQSV